MFYIYKGAKTRGFHRYCSLFRCPGGFLGQYSNYHGTRFNVRSVIGTFKLNIIRGFPEEVQEGKRKTNNEHRHGRCSELFETYHILGCLVLVRLGCWIATELSGSYV